MRQRAFELNPAGADLHAMHEFYDTKFINVEQDALGFFFDPPREWAKVRDCGNFPCTAPKNTMFSFRGNQFSGQNIPSFAAENFTMIPDTPNFSEYVQGCT